MPSPDTFSIPPICALLRRHIPWHMENVVDPFARESTFAHIRNDLNPAMPTQYHMDATDFVEQILAESASDAVLFDPPYSPRQISEVYKAIGRECSTEDTQNARLYKRVKDGLDRTLKPGGIAICCGWNSAGFGTGRGYELIEILLVAHGGAHNDTIVTVEKKGNSIQNDLFGTSLDAQTT